MVDTRVFAGQGLVVVLSCPGRVVARGRRVLGGGERGGERGERRHVWGAVRVEAVLLSLDAGSSVGRGQTTRLTLVVLAVVRVVVRGWPRLHGRHRGPGGQTVASSSTVLTSSTLGVLGPQSALIRRRDDSDILLDDIDEISEEQPSIVSGLCFTLILTNTGPATLTGDWRLSVSNQMRPISAHQNQLADWLAGGSHPVQ